MTCPIVNDRLRLLTQVSLLAVHLSIASVVLLFVPTTFGDEISPAQDGQQWAVLIGAERYHHANHLKYTVNDVRELSSTLRRRGGYDVDHILVITDDEPNARFQPLRTSILKELPVWLNKAAAGDSLFVYFSGHGFRDADGKLYLAPLDCDPNNVATTGISVAWFREQIAACKAGFKLLVLDACHAGSEKGEDDADALPSVAAKDLGDLFRNLESVVTLASSTAGEKSQIWEDKQQSLFSYWLNQGMKGHADNNGDGVVDIDELYKFVYRNVTYTAKARFPRRQTPVRIVRSGTPDVPIVVRLKPLTLRELLSDIAETLADRVDEGQHGKVGVLEFTNDTALGELLGANYGTLGKWCTDECERRLMEVGMGRFSIVDQRRLEKTLKDEGFQIDDLGSGERLRRLSKQVGGMPIVAVGTLRNRDGRKVTIQCKLISVENGNLVGSAGGIAWLNESEWAMLGRSVSLTDEDRRSRIIDGAVVPASQDSVVHIADQRSRGPHPLNDLLNDLKFPYPIKIMVRSKDQPTARPRERKLVFRNVGEGDDVRQECVLPVRSGEVFEIWIGNRSGSATVMRLLVDGLNTLPEKEHVKGDGMN